MQLIVGLSLREVLNINSIENHGPHALTARVLTFDLAPLTGSTAYFITKFNVATSGCCVMGVSVKHDVHEMLHLYFLYLTFFFFYHNGWSVFSRVFYIRTASGFLM